MTDERIVADHGAGVVFDGSLTPDLDMRWFDVTYWQGRKAMRRLGGGRGGVFVVDTPAGECVLRHYRRGGGVARALGDRYLWTGQARMRSLMEFRLLCRLYRAGLPVPRAVGGAWVRSGIYYRADLLTRFIAGGRALSAELGRVRDNPEIADRIGECVGRFHAHGVFHADLNAHNILLDGDDKVSLIDFDRCRIRPPQVSWQQANLARLHRSLMKLDAAGDDVSGWQQHWWGALRAAHARALEAA
ncbi:MAG: 3-deoxy-D-manno-octulosonic acid kinase [Rhodanobacteraceae bacterium]